MLRIKDTDISDSKLAEVLGISINDILYMNTELRRYLQKYMINGEISYLANMGVMLMKCVLHKGKTTIQKDNTAKAVLTDIGTEELAHWEIIATLIFKIVDRATPEELIDAGMGPNYIQHGRDVYPNDAAGVPWTAAYIQAIEDPITNLHEDLAAEQKARTTYEHLINSTKDRGVIETLSFLREREVVHFQRFGETLRLVQEYMDNIKHKR